MRCEKCNTDMALGSNGKDKQWFFCRACGFYVELCHIEENYYARKVHEDAGQVREEHVDGGGEDESGEDIQRDETEGESSGT